MITTLAVGQEMAFSERGDTVVLYADGTWDYYENYISADTSSGSNLPVNEAQFSKPQASNKKVSGRNDEYDIWYDSKEWKRIPPGNINPDAEIVFQLIKGDAYGMVIFEELEIPKESLSQIAVTNALNAAPDIRVVEKELRNVNGNELIWMRMDGTTQGIPVVYSSYYYSWASGSIQFHTFTGQNVYDKYEDQFFELLNGLIIPE